MIPQLIYSHILSIVIGAYVGRFIFRGLMYGDWDETLFIIIVITGVISILWWINRLES